MEEIAKERLNWHGRYLDHNGIRYFDYSGSGFSFVFRGKKAELTIVSDSDKWDEKSKGVLGIYVWEGHEDSLKFLPKKLTKKVILSKNETKITVFESNYEKNVCIFVIKLSECKFGFAGFKSLNIDGFVINKLDSGNCFGNLASGNQLKIEAIGDSITCGFGIEGPADGEFTTIEERPDLSYAFVAAQKLGAELQCCSWSGIGVLSQWIDENTQLPDTDLLMGSKWPYTDKWLSKRLGIEPDVWDGSKFSPDLVIINLGTNDASFVRNKEDRVKLFIAAYKQLIESVHRRSPKAKIFCCYGVMEQSLVPAVKKAVQLFKLDFPLSEAYFLQLPLQSEKDGIGACGHPSEITHAKIGEIVANKIMEICL